MIELTEKQSDALRLKARGLTDKQIARELGMSVEAIKDRMSSIRRKFSAKGDMCAVVLQAERMGLLEGVEV